MNTAIKKYRHRQLLHILLSDRYIILPLLLACFYLHTIPSYANESNTLPLFHGVSVFGQLKYKENFTHFDYVNPNAPKTGKITIAEIGSFDSLNPFIIRGIAENNITLLFDTLMASAQDEIASSYGLIVESIQLDPQKNWVIFNLNNNARFSDNTKVTAKDVAFSFNILKEKGHPHYMAYFRDIESVQILSNYRVKFNFLTNTNRELPLIIGQLPILSKKYYTENDFEKPALEPPLGSGPYKVKKVLPGRKLILEKRYDYWGKNLPVNKGRYNFDEIIIDYYRDATVAVEAFKAGEYDFRRENIAKTWATAYNIEQVKNGLIVKEELKDGTPTGMQAFIFNIRKDDFKDVKVREALSYAYDFEWANKNLFFSAYTRNESYFGNSPFAAPKTLPSEQELALLTPFKEYIPERVFTKLYSPPQTNGSGNNRNNLIKARDLLQEAGWYLRDMKLINPLTNQPVTIEFMLGSPSFERVVSPYIRALKKLGIDATIRTVDSSQYIKRMEEFDFDIMVYWFTQGPLPGNEQINYWHSSRADVRGSRNMVGIKNKAIDAMVEKIISADSMEQLQTATRALDRILLWNFYSIPQWHSRSHRIIYWNKFARPKIAPTYALGFLDTWWVDKKKANELEQHNRN